MHQGDSQDHLRGAAHEETASPFTSNLPQSVNPPEVLSAAEPDQGDGQPNQLPHAYGDIQGVPDPGSSDAQGVPMAKRHLAVDIKDLNLWYGEGPKRVDIFRGVNISVPRGGIYALLGSSGCGKTTLLRCILGRKKFQRGEVRVFGTKPGTPGSKIPGSNVGYMPQELALFDEFTIEETLAFFGQIYYLPMKEWKERVEFLVQFLELPDKQRLVKYLSGGQKRRVSLASSMVHNPPLLVLDEPTVGIDPVLRKSIWQHLVELTTKEKMTVIITTHYIDEARLASLVGFLRQGKMLAEDPPATLMRRHNTHNLEEVFLIMASSPSPEGQPQAPVQTERRNDQGGDEATQYSFLASVVRSKQQTLISLDKKDMSRSIARTKAIFQKNVVKIRRNLGLLLYSFLLPSVEVMLYCIVIGKVPFNMFLAVVNEDNPVKYSRQFLELVDSRIMPQVNYTSLQQALDSVSKGVSYGVVHMKTNFSKGLDERFQQGYVIDQSMADASSIDVYLDMSNQQVFTTIIRYLEEAAERMVTDSFVKAGKSTYGLQELLRLKEPVYGDKNMTFTEFVAPGMILQITYMMAVGLSVNSLLEERSDGLLERCTVAGVKSIEIVVAHIASQMFVIVVQDLLLLFVGFFVFSLPSKGPLWVAIILTLSQGFCGLSLGLMISSIFESPDAAGMVNVGINYPVLILSGIMWPLEGIPLSIRWFSYMMPQTIPCDSMRCVMYKGWTLLHTNVWMGFLVNYIWVVIFLVSTVLFFKQ
ncbi:ABC transporter G family member 20-like [Ornithodoros turicata]|uniref:ABC transporter G family member 20-like n=1 Tax=Ornithodoros turicata TaxID=34597 RepID=UPI003139987B